MSFTAVEARINPIFITPAELEDLEELLDENEVLTKVGLAQIRARTSNMVVPDIAFSATGIDPLDDADGLNLSELLRFLKPYLSCNIIRTVVVSEPSFAAIKQMVIDAYEVAPRGALTYEGYCSLEIGSALRPAYSLASMNRNEDDVAWSMAGLPSDYPDPDFDAQDEQDSAIFAVAREVMLEYPEADLAPGAVDVTALVVALFPRARPAVIADGVVLARIEIAPDEDMPSGVDGSAPLSTAVSAQLTTLPVETLSRLALSCAAAHVKKPAAHVKAATLIIKQLPLLAVGACVLSDTDARDRLDIGGGKTNLRRIFEKACPRVGGAQSGGSVDFAASLQFKQSMGGATESFAAGSERAGSWRGRGGSMGSDKSFSALLLQVERFAVVAPSVHAVKRIITQWMRFLHHAAARRAVAKVYSIHNAPDPVLVGCVDTTLPVTMMRAARFSVGDVEVFPADLLDEASKETMLRVVSSRPSSRSSRRAGSARAGSARSRRRPSSAGVADALRDASQQRRLANRSGEFTKDLATHVSLSDFLRVAFPMMPRAWCYSMSAIAPYDFHTEGVTSSNTLSADYASVFERMPPSGLGLTDPSNVTLPNGVLSVATIVLAAFLSSARRSPDNGHLYLSLHQFKSLVSDGWLRPDPLDLRSAGEAQPESAPGVAGGTFSSRVVTMHRLVQQLEEGKNVPRGGRRGSIVSTVVAGCGLPKRSVFVTAILLTRALGMEAVSGLLSPRVAVGTGETYESACVHTAEDIMGLESILGDLSPAVEAAVATELFASFVDSSAPPSVGPAATFDSIIRGLFPSLSEASVEAIHAALPHSAGPRGADTTPRTGPPPPLRSAAEAEADAEVARQDAAKAALREIDDMFQERDGVRAIAAAEKLPIHYRALEASVVARMQSYYATLKAASSLTSPQWVHSQQAKYGGGADIFGRKHTSADGTPGLALLAACRGANPSTSRPATSVRAAPSVGGGGDQYGNYPPSPSVGGYGGGGEGYDHAGAHTARYIEDESRPPTRSMGSLMPWASGGLPYAQPEPLRITNGPSPSHGAHHGGSGGSGGVDRRGRAPSYSSAPSSPQLHNPPPRLRPFTPPSHLSAFASTAAGVGSVDGGGSAARWGPRGSVASGGYSDVGRGGGGGGDPRQDSNGASSGWPGVSDPKLLRLLALTDPTGAALVGTLSLPPVRQRSAGTPSRPGSQGGYGRPPSTAGGSPGGGGGGNSGGGWYGGAGHDVYDRSRTASASSPASGVRGGGYVRAPPFYSGGSEPPTPSVAGGGGGGGHSPFHGLMSAAEMDAMYQLEGLPAEGGGYREAAAVHRAQPQRRLSRVGVPGEELPPLTLPDGTKYVPGGVASYVIRRAQRPQAQGEPQYQVPNNFKFG